MSGFKVMTPIKFPQSNVVFAENQPEYFEQMTGQPWNKFLNESERLFFLTRGYGRPNRYISQRDLFRRQLYLTAQPTALIPLMDLFGVCAGNQNPSVILERLLGIDLSSIDRYHENAVQQGVREAGD